MKILDFKRDFKELINTFSEVDITSENLEDYIDKFYEELYLICEINQKKISENKIKNAIWWNSNLEIKRRKVRALRRRFQAIVDFEERTARRLIYKRELANYKKEMLIAKQICFRKFLDNVVKKNLFGIPYDIIKQNECNKLNLNGINRGNGIYTNTYKDSRSEILKFHFPYISDDVIIESTSLNTDYQCKFTIEQNTTSCPCDYNLLVI
ncbi:hypothetical protein AVEN_98617-1 [Araneus ventricosus]|uniref:Uncharacterized protein n=1 Tax=Araneus ventricosus TaxID=182803 RepID=A0A4Y2F8J6_ARAVE|nr:hypothetical protein AVEN_98617-1 [Araneus ventricosus]